MQIRLKEVVIEAEPELGKPGLRLSFSNRACGISLLATAEDFKRISHFLDVAAAQLNEQ
jgi:hypothetical protein